MRPQAESVSLKGCPVQASSLQMRATPAGGRSRSNVETICGKSETFGTSSGTTAANTLACLWKSVLVVPLKLEA
jgi:hypothetical protein